MTDPTTPRVDVNLLVRDASDQLHTMNIIKELGWKEWWLAHQVIPEAIRKSAPLRLEGIEITGCANTEDRELYFEDLAFIQETFRSLTFQPRPRRGIDPFPGQDPGANTGRGRLPFPTREETILPTNLTNNFKTSVSASETDPRTYRFLYNGNDVRLEYEVTPGSQGWGPVTVKLNNSPVARAMVGAGPEFEDKPTDFELLDTRLEDGVVRARWRAQVGEKEVTIESALRLWQKSLVVDYFCRGGLATGLSYGRILDVAKPELLLIPFLNYDSKHLHVLMSRGEPPYFGSVWMDWYRSNGSKPYAEDEVRGNEVHLNGGVRYLPRTDGVRNDLFERLFVTFSPTFEEVLFEIPNPPAKRGKEAATRLWQETWGPQDYDKEHERSRQLRAYGIDRLTQCNHEITWRDGGESFTFRTQSAPAKGGDEALARYVQKQKQLGWRSGLYTNYCDFAPVNAFWDPDMVMRDSSGNLVKAWARCYSPKALFAVEMDRKLAPQIQKKFGSNAAYTDVHTSVSPWQRADYDSRVPGAGTFAATFYAYGELLLHDQDVYDGHCWSEGHHQWLYAGLCTGNYGLTYSDLRLWKYPYLPHFDLLKMHPLSVDIGVPWTAQFFTDKEGWDKPENIESSIDQFIAATIAYGHIGWLVEEKHGIRQTARSYYMLQQLQSRYAMQRPEVIRYGGSSGLVSSSEAFQTGAWKESRLYVRYPGSLEVWVNGNATKDWEIEVGGEKHLLPPFGWLARQGQEYYSGSEVMNGKRFDLSSSAEYLFLDGRGTRISKEGISTSGSLAVRPGSGQRTLSIITIDGVDSITIQPVDQPAATNPLTRRIGEAAKAERLAVRAINPDGQELGRIEATRNESGWVIRADSQARRYEISW